MQGTYWVQRTTAQLPSGSRSFAMPLTATKMTRIFQAFTIAPLNPGSVSPICCPWRMNMTATTLEGFSVRVRSLTKKATKNWRAHVVDLWASPSLWADVTAWRLASKWWASSYACGSGRTFGGILTI